MAAEFGNRVQYGLNLSKRLYYGKSTAASPVLEPQEMKRSVSVAERSSSYLPEAVMVYAVIKDPQVVDNPDVPSYQPYVHGECEPPALIPLQMLGIGMGIDCCLDNAFVAVKGTWRLHCVMSSKSCDCRIAVPISQQGSLLGVEVGIGGRSYSTKLISVQDSIDNLAKSGLSCLKGQIYTLKIPQVIGGSILSIKVNWSQKLRYQEGQFCLSVPFTFPAYVLPLGKKIPKREKIELNVNSGINEEIICKCTSHPLKDVGKMSFLYDAEVLTWSNADFKFLYTVSSSDIFGGVLLQSPPLNDFDQRQMFCLYLFPGKSQIRKVFRKEVVFLVDISGSMRGNPLEDARRALLASLSKLNPQDTFNIIAFSGEVLLFSPSMELASEGAILNATRWLSDNLIASGGTNILLPLKQAMKLLSDTIESIPLIFLITDGAVEDEREICNVMKSSLTSTRSSISPRICTFGIGLYCNHYFLQMLAQIGRGHYDCACDPDYIESGIQRLFTAASSVILANIAFDADKHLDSLELFPSHIPDLSFGSPLIVSGRYRGNFPDSVEVSGIMADMSNFVIGLKARKAKDIPLDRVLARRQIDILTAHAWLSESKELEDKVAKMSIQSGVPSEYTHMILLQSGKKAPEPVFIQEVLYKMNMQKKVDMEDTSSEKTIIILGSLGIGFGNLKATTENIPPGTEETKSSQAAEMLVRVTSGVLNQCCCGMCLIRTCSHMNNQCSIVLSQICAALACFECLSCCCELCECLSF